MKVLVGTDVGWNGEWKGLRVRSRTRKKIKKILEKTITTEEINFLLWRLRDVLALMIGSECVLKLKNYLEYRKKREKLLKAAKYGINVGELKEILKKSYYHRYVPKEKEIKFVDFEEPFLLVGNHEKRILYTPFGSYEVGKDVSYARQAFRKFTNVKRVPHGKDAMKKIEALLIKASI